MRGATKEAGNARQLMSAVMSNVAKTGYDSVSFLLAHTLYLPSTFAFPYLRTRVDAYLSAIHWYVHFDEPPASYPLFHPNTPSKRLSVRFSHGLENDSNPSARTAEFFVRFIVPKMYDNLFTLNGESVAR